MNFIITNYATESHTEPMYLNAAFNAAGCKSVIWNNAAISAYDIFDLIKPNYYIAHIGNIIKDVIYYVNENKGIEFILNISGVREEVLNQTLDMLEQYNVNIAFLFTNESEHQFKTKYNILNLPFGCDIFLGRNNLKYSINKGQIVLNKSDIKTYDTSYHTISYRSDIKSDVDIYLPTVSLSNIYSNYDNIVFRSFKKTLQQSLFDAIYYGNKVYYDLDDKENARNISEKVKKLLRTDIDICDEQSIDPKELKKKVLEKHTCLHRAKSFLSQLPAKDFIDKLDILIDKELT